MTDCFFTIVIPVKAVNAYVRETVDHILRLTNPDWELIIVPNEDSQSEWPDPRIRMISSGRVGPGVKRDLAAQSAQGSVLVFLDDDSYPKDDLLSVARPFFDNPLVAGVGGPAVTPPEDGFWQKVSGAVFLSHFSGGSPERYVPLGEVHEVHDWPSVNLMIRKSDFLAVGGFDCAYWPGEVTKLCLDLIKTGKKILYCPELVVWHHRRAGLWAHLRQIGGYGLHRGFFAKRFPETSFKIGYFAPSLFLTFVLLTGIGLLVGMPPLVRGLFTAGWALYGLVLVKAFFDFVRFEPARVAAYAVAYTFFTHLFYGLQFIRGFVFTRNLVSRLR
jgi:glycosyltransferase involved in cell wall biosynthesis